MLKSKIFALSLYLFSAILLLISVSPVHAAVYEYNYTGQNFTYGVGPDFASSYSTMHLTLIRPPVVKGNKTPVTDFKKIRQEKRYG
jgi:hypothetical protein